MHTEVNSGHLHSVDYNPLTQTLEVAFQNGAVYQGRGVLPEHHQSFMSADSPGTHYHQVIKQTYDMQRVK